MIYQSKPDARAKAISALFLRLRVRLRCDRGLFHAHLARQDRHNRPFFSQGGESDRLLTVFPGSTIQPLPIRVTSCLVRPILCQRELAGIGRALPP